MSIRIEPHKPYHLTCVVNQLLPVFSQPLIARIAMDSWLYQRQHHGMKLYGYVIMEEHLHFLAGAGRLDLCLSGFMEQTEAQILEYITVQKLERFSTRLAGMPAGSGSGGILWEQPPGIEPVEGGAMMRKTLDYIHINPVKRGYVDRAGQWRYSSARNYDGGAGLLEIDLWQ